MKKLNLSPRRFFKRVRTNIITGFLLIIPLGATIFVIKWLLFAIDNLISKNWFPGVGVVVVLAIAFFTGLLAKNYFGRMLIETGNTIISNIPLMNKIYLGVQQILDSIVSGKKKLFEKAVLIEYPKKNSYCIGFVTAETTGELPRKTNLDLLSIFVPTTPNPTSGFLLFIPRSEVIELDMGIETAIKTVMSFGMVNPDHLKRTDHLYTIPSHLKNFNWLKMFSKNKRLRVDPRD